MVASSAVNLMSIQRLGTSELLFRCARQMNLMPIWVAAGVFAISVGEREMYINLARSPLNSDASAALAKNKYVTRRILERHDMQNIPFTLPRTHAEAEVFLSLHGTVVAKPVTGAGARDIHIVAEPAQLKTLKINRYILEKYITGKELRFLVLNGAVVGVHHSEYGTSVAEDRLLQRISYPESDWDLALLESSLRIADILNLKFTAIDYLIDASGKAYVLEVNTMPGLKWFHAPSSGPVVDIARLFLESVVDAVCPEQRPTRKLAVSNPGHAYSELVRVN